jgi:hypothetical protein
VQMQKKLLLALLFLFLALSTVFISILNTKPAAAPTDQIAQNAALIWEKVYGGNGDDRAFTALAVEGGFLVAGSTTSLTTNNLTAAWVLRTDQQGNAVWNVSFLENCGAEFRCVLNAADGFLLVGNTFLQSGNTESYIAKINRESLQLWNQTVKAENASVKVFSGVKAEDGFFLVGLSKAAGREDSDFWLAKFDEEGSLLWSRTFGGETDEAGRAVALTADNCLVVAGYVDLDGEGNFDYLVLKLDLLGSLLWSKTFGGAESDKATCIAIAEDGVVVGGDTRSKGAGDCDAWIIKVDLQGELVWDRTFGGAGFDTPSCVCLAADGFVFGGTTFSFGNGNRDFWMFKVSCVGEVLWSCTVGRGGYEEAYAVVDAGCGEFFVAGWTNSLGLGRYDFYGVKIAPET